MGRDDSKWARYARLDSLSSRALGSTHVTGAVAPVFEVALVPEAEAGLLARAASAPGERPTAIDRSTPAARLKSRASSNPRTAQSRLPIALVVDDEPALARLWQRVLAQRGWCVDHALTAADALRCLAQAGAHFDLAIVDDELPDGRGLHLTKFFRALRPEPVAVLVSAFVDAERWVEASKAGFVLIRKPASVEQCVELLDLLDAHPEAATSRLHSTHVGPSVLVLRDDGVETPEGPVRLRPMEHAILALLLTREGERLTSTVIGALIGRTDDGTSRGVHKQMSNLRAALGTYRGIIETVTGGGYRLRPGSLRRERGLCAVSAARFRR